jgi:hypothetical protein
VVTLLPFSLSLPSLRVATSTDSVVDSAIAQCWVPWSALA